MVRFNGMKSFQRKGAKAQSFLALAVRQPQSLRIAPNHSGVSLLSSRFSALALDFPDIPEAPA